MPKKLTYEHVKNYIESFEGYELLSEEYKGNKDNLELKCPNDHQFKISFNNFQSGYRCVKCYNEIRWKNRKLSYKEVKEYIESFKGYRLLSKTYTNNFTKLKVICPYDHHFKISYDKFKQGKGCSYCFNIKRKNNKGIIKSLEKYEKIRENENKEIEVTCRYCGDWFVPERWNLTYRIRCINGEIDIGESNFYCSDQCKKECPIFYQKKYPKGYKKATSREVQPQLRQLVLKKDNYTCQKCGKHKDQLEVGLHCHHKWPLNEEPVKSADIDECVTLCKSCHKEAHKVPGCNNYEMRCSE